MSNPFTKGYKAPKQDSKYLSFKEEGSYLVRVLTPKTEVVTYFAEFLEDAEGKYNRFIYEDKGDGMTPPSQEPLNGKPPKLNWAVIVFDKVDEGLKVWEIPQKSIQEFLFSIASGKMKSDWTKFDIQITKKGQKLETKYTLMAGDTEELSEEQKEKVEKDLPKISLKKLESGDDPFETSDNSSR